MLATGTLSLAQHKRILGLIWAGMAGSSVVYVVLAYVLTTRILDARLIPATYDREILTAIAVIWVVALVGVPWWRRRALASLETSRGPDVPLRFQAAHVTCWSLGEIPAGAGFGGTLLTSDMRLVIAGSVLSLILIGLLLRPDFSILDEAARRAGLRDS